MIKLFVGGFPLETQELELVQLLNLHGDVVTIKIIRDKKTRICKGYAFVEVSNLDNAERIIEALDGASWKGRLLKVSIVPREAVEQVKLSYVKVERNTSALKQKRPRRIT